METPPNKDAGGPSAQGTTRQAKPDTNQTGHSASTLPPAKQVALDVVHSCEALAAVAALLAALPDPLAEIELRRQLCREADHEAYQRGERAGYERRARVLDAEWPAVVAPVVDGGPSHDELEARRWGPGGREHFGDPRPGDRFPKARLEAAS